MATIISIDSTFIKNIVSEFEKLNIQYTLDGAFYSYMKSSCKEFYAFYDSIGISREYLKNDYNLSDIDTYKVEMLCPDEKAVNFCLSLVNNNPEYDYFHSIDEKSFELYSKKNTKFILIFILFNLQSIFFLYNLNINI